METPLVLSYRHAVLGDKPDDCYRCGYPLIGIADDQPCPECGLLARRSRRSTDELHNTRPRWLRRISRGANLVLLSIVVAITWFFLWVFEFQYAGLTTFAFGWPVVWNLLPLIGLASAALLLLLGTFMLTAREGYPPADSADRWLRIILRLAAFVPLVVMLLMIAQTSLNYGSRWWSLLYQSLSIAMAVVALAAIPLPLLFFLHLRGLARRARSAHLAEHCLIVGIGTSVALLYFAAISVIMDNADNWGFGTYWTSRSNIALAMIVLFATFGILFVLWSLYLLTRFAISFRRAARELRRKWTDDDRALADMEHHITL